MKKLIIGILVIIFQIAGHSQSSDSLIKVSEDVELIKITEHAYIHVSYIEMQRWGRVGANGLLYVHDNKAFLFDTPWTEEQTEDLINWVKGSMNLEIIGFVPNHWHKDCMGGLASIQKHKIKSYANQMTIDIAKSKGLPTPDIGFTDSLELKLGDIQILCYYLGAAHSMDNIAVWIPSERILFPACMVKTVSARNLGNTADGDVDAYPKTLKSLLQKFPSAEVVILGHGSHGGLELVKHTLELAKE